LDESQLLKGILEGCILSIISKGETYGYEIISELEKNGFSNLLEGTLYPILTRLDKKGYITCRKVKSPFGPIRKYYKITEEGSQVLEQFLENYRKINASAQQILFAR
jgi:Predicted transcriptional regulators